MNLPVFDTHKAVKYLTQAGADEPLAEAVVTTIGIAMGEHMATKADLKDFEQNPAAHMDLVADRLIARLDLFERRMTIRLGGLIVVGFTVLAALIKL